MKKQIELAKILGIPAIDNKFLVGFRDGDTGVSSLKFVLSEL